MKRGLNFHPSSLRSAVLTAGGASAVPHKLLRSANCARRAELRAQSPAQRARSNRGGQPVQENNGPAGPCRVGAIFGGTRLACYFCLQGSGGEGAARGGGGLSSLQLASVK